MPEQPTIDRALFRKAEDGTTVFYPWGFTHRGYQVPGEAAQKKASRAASILVTSTIAIGTWTAYVLQSILESEVNGRTEILKALAAPGSALFVVVVSYWLWVSWFVERLPESDLKVSREERLREAAEAVGPWKVALFGVTVCSLSAILIWLQPDAWWLGLLGVALGAGALFWSSVLKRAAASPPV